MPKATNTPSEYVILIDFPLQQWLQERASVLRYVLITCIVQFQPTPEYIFFFRFRTVHLDIIKIFFYIHQLMH